MKIFLTGGAGYIGSVLTRELVDAGYDVTVYDTFYFGEEALNDVEDKVRLIKGDIRKIKMEDLRGQDVVIDLAAMSNDPAGELDPKLTESVNHLGRVHVAKSYFVMQSLPTMWNIPRWFNSLNVNSELATSSTRVGLLY